jgi:hypothetical protein
LSWLIFLGALIMLKEEMDKKSEVGEFSLDMGDETMVTHVKEFNRADAR